MKRLLPLLFFCLAALQAAQVYATFDVEADKRSDLTLTSTGVIKTMQVDVGDHVKKGDELLQLDNDDLKLAVKLAESDVRLAQISHRFAKQTYEHYRKMRDVIDDDVYDQHRLAFEKSAASLQATKASLAYKKALLAKSILLAPYDGVISKRHKEVGDGVSGGMIEPILTLISDARVKLVLGFDEKYWQQVKVGAKVNYKVDGSDATYTGTITGIYPTVDAKTRKAHAELYATGLRPGLFGEAMIEVE